MSLNETASPAAEIHSGGAGGSRGKDWIQLRTGQRFYLFDPDPASIRIEDIAHGLALTNRFSGQCREPYSVAQHSVLVSYACDPADALWGLMHDASEAYIADVATPLKRHASMTGYRLLEQKLMDVIASRFGLPSGPQGEPESVRRADRVLLATEVRDLFDEVDPHWAAEWFDGAEKLPERIVPWGWRRARSMFLKRWGQLTGEAVGDAALQPKVGLLESVGAEATSSNYRERDGTIQRGRFI